MRLCPQRPLSGDADLHTTSHVLETAITMLHELYEFESYMLEYSIYKLLKCLGSLIRLMDILGLKCPSLYMYVE